MISRTKKVTNAVVDTTDGDLGSVTVSDPVVGPIGLPDAFIEATKEPTLDRFLDGNPKIINTDQDYTKLVAVLRANRARDIVAEVKKKAKKEGVDDDDQNKESE